jgi:hypothetical protein
MQYLWKHFLDNKDLPNIMFQQTLKGLLIDKLEQTGDRNYDQDFLRDIIYAEIKNDSLVHATFHKFEEHSIDFPVPYDAEFRFVGEYIYHDGKRSNQHLMELLRALAAMQSI